MSKFITTGFVVKVNDGFYVSGLDVGQIGDDAIKFHLQPELKNASFILLRSMAEKFVKMYTGTSRGAELIPVEIYPERELKICQS